MCAFRHPFRTKTALLSLEEKWIPRSVVTKAQVAFKTMWLSWTFNQELTKRPSKSAQAI